VPLGDAHLELIAVVDPDAAASGAIGRWVASGQVEKPLGWAVGTGKIDAVAHRLDRTPGARSRQGDRRRRWVLVTRHFPVRWRLPAFFSAGLFSTAASAVRR
jgi:hypothetical protein